MIKPARELSVLAPRIYFRDRPDVTLLRPCLGLTFFLEPADGWAEGWASELFTSFLASVDTRTLRWWSSSSAPTWRKVDDADELGVQLRSGSLVGRSRHLFRFCVADDPHAHSVGFTYHEVSPRRAPPLGYVELSLPVDGDTDALLALAIEVAQRFPIACGIGGYSFRWNRRYPRNSFHAAFACCRRFLGVDLQEPETMAWHAPRWLPGTGWLTLLGATAARAEIGLAALSARAWVHDVNVMRLRHATLIRAGRTPQIGDLNSMEYPWAQAEVARLLHPYIARSFELPGRFEEEAATDSWRARLVIPEVWS